MKCKCCRVIKKAGAADLHRNRRFVQTCARWGLGGRMMGELVKMQSVLILFLIVSADHRKWISWINVKISLSER